jgi:hypothetical protein
MFSPKMLTLFAKGVGLSVSGTAASNILSWWKALAVNFSKLSPAAKQILVIMHPVKYCLGQPDKQL